MKKILIPVLILMLVVGASTLGLANEIKDVDSSHWAYKSVKMLIDKGYISLYEDNTFRGDKSVSRYQIAEIIARMLQSMGEGTVTPSTGDISNIRELTVEFRNEIVEIVQNQKLILNRLAEVEKNQNTIKEQDAKNIDEIDYVNQQIKEIITELITFKDDLDNANSEIDSLKIQLANVEKGVKEEIRTDLDEINSRLQVMEKENQNNLDVIKRLETENAELKSEIAALHEKNTNMIYYMIGGLLLSLLIK